jgi:hypothetical protein
MTRLRPPTPVPGSTAPPAAPRHPRPCPGRCGAAHPRRWPAAWARQEQGGELAPSPGSAVVTHSHAPSPGGRRPARPGASTSHPPRHRPGSPTPARPGRVRCRRHDQPLLVPARCRRSPALRSRDTADDPISTSTPTCSSAAVLGSRGRCRGRAKPEPDLVFDEAFVDCRQPAQRLLESHRQAHLSRLAFEPPFHSCLGEVHPLMGESRPSRFEEAEVAQPGDCLAA